MKPFTIEAEGNIITKEDGILYAIPLLKDNTLDHDNKTEIENQEKRFTVFVGATEVNDYLLTLEEAYDKAKYFFDQNYDHDDICIDSY